MSPEEYIRHREGQLPSGRETGIRGEGELFTVNPYVPFECGVMSMF